MATILDIVFAAIEAGFSSVMYDGSALPLEDNIRNTRQVVARAKEYGVSVEAELGVIGGREDTAQGASSELTDP